MATSSAGFSTPAELAAHLREMVDDEAWIAHTVAIHFPTARLQQRLNARDELRRRYENERKQAQTKKVTPDEPGLTCDRSHSSAMQVGSQNLLNALWRAHPAILKRLGAMK